MRSIYSPSVKFLPKRYDPYDPDFAPPIGVNAIGSGGGGGASGEVSYPDYLETAHGLLLNAGGADSPSYSIVDALNSAYGNSPFSGVSAYNPDTAVTALLAGVEAYNTVVDALDHETDWESMVDTATTKIDAVFLPSAYITSVVSAYSDRLDDRIENEALPRFKSGMRDVNAVMTSAFVMGQAYIEGMATRDVAEFQEKLELQAQLIRANLIDSAIKAMIEEHKMRVDGEKNVAYLTIEGNRYKIVAKKEEADENLRIDDLDAKWDLSIFAYPGNFIASIGSGTYVPFEKDTKTSALSGALSGAAMGAMVGGPTGAVVGGVLGLGASFLQ